MRNPGGIPQNVEFCIYCCGNTPTSILPFSVSKQGSDSLKVPLNCLLSENKNWCNRRCRLQCLDYLPLSCLFRLVPLFKTAGKIQWCPHNSNRFISKPHRIRTKIQTRLLSLQCARKIKLASWKTCIIRKKINLFQNR